MVVNLLAFRHTDPRMLHRAEDPVGPAGDDALRLLTAAAPRTIAAWGNGGSRRGRFRAVAPLLDRPLCLGTTATGQPLHPLYVPRDAPLVPWAPP